MTIEGIPEGWELVRIGCPVPSVDWVVNQFGEPVLCSVGVSTKNYVIIRKIEKPKQYRAFENAAEFKPHRDRWVEYTSPNCDYSMYQISAYSSQRVWLGPNATGIEYREAFHCLKFDDGTPFGVEATS